MHKHGIAFRGSRGRSGPAGRARVRGRCATLLAASLPRRVGPETLVGYFKVKRQNIPFFAVPTTAGPGSKSRSPPSFPTRARNGSWRLSMASWFPRWWHWTGAHNRVKLRTTPKLNRNTTQVPVDGQIRCRGRHPYSPSDGAGEDEFAETSAQLGGPLAIRSENRPRRSLR